MKTTVIYHSADWDGQFCGQIAKKFLPDAEFIGWDFKDAPLESSMLHSCELVILDLPVDRVFGLKFKDGWICRGDEQVQPIDRWDSSNIVWIDHHASSIETHPKDIPGYRIDGVAACRLAWQWFSKMKELFHPTAGAFAVPMPDKQAFIDRTVQEPWAVRLAGEYDVWDKRDPDAELFQHGLRSENIYQSVWEVLLSNDIYDGNTIVRLLNQGRALQFSRDNEYRDVITSQGFDVEFHGIKFLACCSHECDIRSHLFKDGIKPYHQALMGFTFTGKAWRVSLYQIEGKKDMNVLNIAKMYGGGGHIGACGFVTNSLPFLC